MYEVLLYYKFRDIEDPGAFRDEHARLCEDLGLKGRIYVAREGLNGTCAGRAEDTARYRDAVEAMSGFGDIHWKRQQVERIPFAHLRVKTRPTIVNLGLEDDVVPGAEGGVHLTPEQWREMLEGEEPFVLLDVRNRYEWEVGRFKGAEPAPFDQFFEFPRWAASLEAPKDQPVLMYCTGGIRCEKFSGLLKREGYERVYQLSGGVLGYAAEEGGAHWEGKCFVFDDRMTVDIGGESPRLATCRHCGVKTDIVINCANMDCHQLIFVCEDCAVEHRGTCSDQCIEAPRLREFTAEHLSRPYRSRGLEHIVTPESA